MNNLTLSQPELKQRIVIGRDFYLEELEKFIAVSDYKSIFLIYDTNLKKEKKEIANLLKNKRFSSYGIRADQEKSTNLVISAIKKMQIFGCLRNTLLIALGGGFIGDISGVVSSVYMRGIDYIQIGTTAMSQFDAIVQKVAVNVNRYKNIMGAFHSPILTFCDTKFVEKDPSCLNSFCEVIKHKILVKNSLKQLQELENRELKNGEFSKIIYDSLKVKLNCVAHDPFDTLGIQKKLSLGHTIANIIETKTSLTHGEAVWIGLLVAIRVSLFLCPKSNYLADLDVFTNNFIVKHKVKLPKITLKKDDILPLLKKDKISMDKGLSMVIINEKNEVSIKNDLSIDTIISAMRKTPYIRVK